MSVVCVLVDEALKRRLIADAVKASRAAARARSEADLLSAERRAAIRAAMDAGVPRQELADALDVDRTVLYQIIRRGQAN